MKNSLILGTLYIGLLSLFLVSCAGKITSISAPRESQATRIEQASVKEAWESEWELAQKEARKEGKVTFYTTIGPAERQALADALKEYGLALESVAARPTELSEKILRESRAGIYNADFMIAGLATYYPGMKSGGLLAPLEPLLILPEVRDPGMWYKGQLPFADKDKTILYFAAYPSGEFHINTDIVKPGDINSLQDLLAPRWQGKIIMYDPTIAGRANQWMAIVTITMGEEFVKQLANQKPFISRDQRQIMEWIAKGRYPIGIGVAPDMYREFKEAGAPVDGLLLKKASYLTAGAGYIVHINRAPHPNASRVFLNWFLSKKGQMVWSRVKQAQSIRADIPADYFKEFGIPVREAGVDYIDTTKESWNLEERPRTEKIFIEAFLPLVR